MTKTLTTRLLASTLLTSLSLAAAPAFAQDVPPAAPAEEEVAAETDTSVADDQAIVVTGSRIRRAGFDTVEPAIVVDEQFIEDRGFTNVADALNEVPSFGLPGSSGAGAAQGINNVGANFVNAFGLGSQRTLTVVNGRRFVAANSPTVFNQGAPGLQVDLNVIPVGLIDRIETIAVGGAPVYGSDAIAGTVNVILKRNFEGAEVSSSYGISERGDVDDFRISGLMGANFADGRGNVMVAVEYNKKGGLVLPARSRDFAESLSFQTNPDNTGPDDGIPDRLLINDPRVTFVNHDGLPSFFFGNPFIGAPVADGRADILQFDRSGNLVPFDPGRRFGLVFSDGGDGIDLDDLSSLLTPINRTLINGIGRFEVTDGVELYTELFFAGTRANDQITQAGYNTDFFAGSSAAIRFNVTNPFLSDAAAATIQQNCIDYGLGADPADCEFLLSRTARSIALGNNETRQNLYRIVAGVRGDFELLGRPWDYDVSLNYGRTDNNSRTDGINDRRFSFALDAVEVDAGDIAGLPSSAILNVVRAGSVLMDTARSALRPGDIVCRVELDRPTPTGGGQGIPEASLDLDVDACVPLNYFGEGNTTAEARRYVNVPFSATSEIVQRIFEANVGGALFDLPGGSVAAAIGFQHREERAAFDPDFAYANGIGRSAPITATAGSFTTNEFYGELTIPLVSRNMDWPVLSSATVEAKARYVDNSRAGGDWTYTAGGRIGFFDDSLAVRGNYTRSIRSPALVELFLPVSQTFAFSNDPCDASLITGGPNPQNRAANCRDQAAQLGFAGIDTFQSTVINGSVMGTTGGNPNLSNEKADAFTVGLIVNPSFVPRLALVVDYINIKIEDAISQLALQQVMEACYDADPSGFPNEFCDRFSRFPGNDPNGRGFQVQNGFTSGYLNAGSQDFQGVQAQLSYNFDLADVIGGGDGDHGRLSLSGSLFHLIEQRVSITGFDLTDTLDTIGNSDWRGQLNLRYDRGPVGFLWQARWLDAAIFSNSDTEESRDPLGVGDYWLFNAGFFFRPSDNLEVQFNVDNVFDTDQPFAAGASANSTAYDFIGRYFRASAKLAF